MPSSAAKMSCCELTLRTLKMTYLDACAKYNMDPFATASAEKLNKLVSAGLLRKVKGSKGAIAKAIAAGLPGEEAAALWVTAEQSNELLREQSSSSTFRCERSM